MTDRDGRFGLLLRTGSSALTFRSLKGQHLYGRATVVVADADDQDISIALAAAETWSGQVVDKATGQPVPETTLTLRPPGRFDLEVMGPEGRPVVWAYPTGRSIEGARIELIPEKGKTSDASGRLELLVPAGALEIELASQRYRALVDLHAETGRHGDPADHPHRAQRAALSPGTHSYVR